MSAAISSKMPRRLGQDATRAQLAVDKRTGRKVCNTYRQLWKMFNQSMDAPPPPDWRNWPVITNDRIMARVGATVIWDRQIDYLIGVVNDRILKLEDVERMALIGGLKSWHNKHKLLLDWECGKLHHIKDSMEGEEQRMEEKYAILTSRPVPLPHWLKGKR